MDPCGDIESLSEEEIEETISDVDNFHLSDAGHAWWAHRILAELAGIGTTPTVSDAEPSR